MEQDFSGGRQVIRQAFLAKGTPPLALNATLAALSDATIAQYNKSLRLWWTFCKKKQINLFSPPVTLVLEFLASTLASINAYSSLNTYRAARFYNRPIISNQSFQLAILNTQEVCDNRTQVQV
ncbi:hypothetical protein ALC57_11953 [Trachymyrmex cornetzi]|uniref:Uncharacterized protein n=1 Tax=Trachymyrmex cornetzi TaxID=471704 RepID=A0A151J1P1_9HYME|nr:hypothetical protein ALC57_11953 [Trachymyrmex cornetzi]